MSLYRKRSCLTLILVLLLAVDALIVHTLLTDRYRYLVVHHSASQHDNYASIKQFHAKRFLADDAAYHLLLSNGSTEVPLGHLEATQRYRDLSYAIATRSPRYNQQGLHICIVGDYERNEPSADVAAAAGQALNTLCERFDIPADRILLHRDVNATTCPGRFVTQEVVAGWMRDAAGRCPVDVARQQAGVVADCGLTWRTFPEVALLLLALLNVGVPVGGYVVCRRRARARDSRRISIISTQKLP